MARMMKGEVFYFIWFVLIHNGTCSPSREQKDPD